MSLSQISKSRNNIEHLRNPQEHISHFERDPLHEVPPPAQADTFIRSSVEVPTYRGNAMTILVAHLPLQIIYQDYASMRLFVEAYSYISRDREI